MPKRILLVEDDLDVREFLEPYLADKDYEVAVAVNGREGWEKLLQFKPDLMILDLMMPRLDGISLLKIMSDSPRIRKPRVLVLTAVQELKQVEEAMAFGADAYLLKPIDNSRLLKKIQDLIG